MLIVLIIILMLIGASVVGSIYSNFLIFYSNFSESENYHRAYYTAISALERGELVVKQRQPGYEGYGGWQINKNTGNVDNKGSYNQPPNSNPDYRIGSNFSYLSDSGKPSTIFRTINSRASQIPAEGKGDVEGMLSYYNSTNTGENSNNYNMMDYNDAELFLLYYDNVNSSPYDKITISQCTDSAPAEINGKIRLPKLLSDRGFGNLDTNHASIGQSNELPPNDAIIDRQVRGLTKSDRVQYTIYSTQSTAGSRIFLDDDTAIREADINNTLTFSFSNNRDIIRNSGTHGNRNPVTIISQKESVIKNNYGNFTSVFRNTNTTQNQVRFSILNLLKSVNNKIYPFLEYQITFKDNSGNPVVIPDKYYTINAEGNFSDYQINIIVQKPTAKESVLRNFTSIF